MQHNPMETLNKISRRCVSLLGVIVLVILFTSKISSGQELLLFGGENHDVFLGCLTCGKYDQSSVWNRYGEFGSKYTQSSIWNPYGTFGSKYNRLSPWNRYSNSAPMVVDREGQFYGYFSVNHYHARRTKVEFLVAILDNHEWVLLNLEKVMDDM